MVLHVHNHGRAFAGMRAPDTANGLCDLGPRHAENAGVEPVQVRPFRIMDDDTGNFVILRTGDRHVANFPLACVSHELNWNPTPGEESRARDIESLQQLSSGCSKPRLVKSKPPRRVTEGGEFSLCLFEAYSPSPKKGFQFPDVGRVQQIQFCCAKCE